MTNLTLASLKAGVALIPYVGGAFNSIINDIQAIRTSRELSRLKELIDDLCVFKR